MQHIHRGPFEEVAGQALGATVDQLLLAYGIADAATWAPILARLAEGAAAALSPAEAVAHGTLDPRFYIKACFRALWQASPHSAKLSFL
jgi:hypothetical protein